MLGVVRLAGLVDDGVESVVLVGGVLDGADGAVGVVNGVLALDNVTVAGFPLVLEVSGMRVVHCVVKLVLGVGLKFYANLVEEKRSRLFRNNLIHLYFLGVFKYNKSICRN
jgi:hypothetical protein